MEIKQHIPKQPILPFATTWMDLQGIQTKRNKSDRERKIPYDLTYMWNLLKS